MEDLKMKTYQNPLILVINLNGDVLTASTDVGGEWPWEKGTEDS